MGRIDYSLYLVTDRALSRGRATAEIVREAVAGVFMRRRNLNP